MKLFLASTSERRKELLERLTDNFYIESSNFDETTVIFRRNCADYVMDLAEGKACSTGLRLEEEGIVIGCDTVVFADNKVLGKPHDKADAFDMLKLLSGRTHQVYSGIALYNTFSKKLVRDYVITDVTFSSLSDETIIKYIDTGEPMDKAGAYGIQGFGGVFVERINGCYYNVVGLPINKLNSMLRDMGVNL